MAQGTIHAVPASGALVEVQGVGILLACGNTVPANAATGYAKACLYLHTDGANGNETMYVNVGTSTAANFDPLGEVAGLSTTTNTIGIPLFDWRVFDAPLTPLGVTALSADDLLFTPGTFATSAPTLEGSDVGGTTGTQHARQQIVVPADYVAGGAIAIVVTAGVERLASTSATLDIVAVRTAVPDGDIVDTAAQSINSVTAAAKTFVLTPTNIVPGDVLDVKLTTAVSDADDAGANINSVISAVTLSYTAYR